MNTTPKHNSMMRVTWLAIGALLFASPVASLAAQEVKIQVRLSDLPAVIKTAIEESVPNGEIMELEKEVAGENPGQYDVVVRAGGKRYEIEISPQGKLLEKKAVGEEAAVPAPPKQWTKSFDQRNCTFSSVGRNRFLVLEPGHQLVLESAREKVVITVLEATKKIGNVEARVIEEREEEGGKLKEISRNFFAICKEHGDVFYFGEEVDDYEEGKIAGHSGAWRADAPDSQAGLMMPGTILLGARYYQEIAPNAMDRAEIVRDDVILKTPAGTFENCLRVEETSGLDAADHCLKTYAPGIGLIQDEDLMLTKWRSVK
jgi:hypothetical protein